MHSVCCVSSVTTEILQFCAKNRREKEEKKTKIFQQNFRQSVQKKLKFKLEPTLSLLFHHISSLRAHHRDREVFCLKPQKQLYHHARLRERERETSYAYLSLLCVYIYFKNVKSSVFWVKDKFLFSKTDRVFVFIINARKLRRRRRQRRRRQRCRC